MFRNDILAGKRILITGGGTGLGRQIGEGYLRLGAELYICGRRRGVLEQAAKDMMALHGGSVKFFECDIRNASAVDEMVEKIWEDGPLTGLINNAAGNFISRTEDLSPRGFDAIANIVFHGTFYVTHAVGKRWIAGKLPGSIISILVTWVWTGAPYVVPSAMSKTALEGMTKSLAVEWGHYGIRVNAIAPGTFPTEAAFARLRPAGMPISRGDNNPLGRVGNMPELQNLATFLMADGCDFLTGQTIAVDGGGYLANGASFTELAAMTDDDWVKIRAAIKAANDKDKANRTV